MILDSRTLQSTPESGARVRLRWGKRPKGSKVHAAVDTLGYLLALHVTRPMSRIAHRSRAGQASTANHGENVELAYVDQGYTGEAAEEAAAEHESTWK